MVPHDSQTGEVIEGLPEDITLHKIDWSKPRSNILKAMLAAQKQLQPAEKDCYNKHIDSKYAGMESVMKAYKPFSDQNILLTQSPITKPDEVFLVTELTHVDSEEWCRTVISCRPPNGKNALHDLGGTITYLRRYAIPPVTGIVAGEDNDGNHAERHNDQRKQQDKKRQDDGLPTKEDFQRWEAKFKELAAARFRTEKEAKAWLKDQEPNLSQVYTRRLGQLLGILTKRPVLAVEGEGKKTNAQAQGDQAEAEDPKQREAAQRRFAMLASQKGLKEEESRWWAGWKHGFGNDPEKGRPSSKFTPLANIREAIDELSKMDEAGVDYIRQAWAEALEELRLATEEAAQGSTDAQPV